MPLAGLPAPMQSTLTRVLSTAKNVWATSTWDHRTSVWGQFQKYVATLPPDVTPDLAMALFVEQKTILPSSKVTYANTLASLAKRSQIDVPLLRLYSAGLRNAGATNPTRQAPPVTVSQMQSLLQSRLDLSVRAIVFVMWKAASRWDDVAHLTLSSFTIVSDRKVLVTWGPTKSNRQCAFQPSSWTLIEHRLPMTLLLGHLASLAPDGKFAQITSADFLRRIRAVATCDNLTLHSFKRGALSHLNHQVNLGLLEAHILPLIAKHADPLSRYPASTLRYLDDHVAKAEMLGTGRATILL
jgi:hypothetical protein